MLFPQELVETKTSLNIGFEFLGGLKCWSLDWLFHSTCLVFMITQSALQEESHSPLSHTFTLWWQRLPHCSSSQLGFVAIQSHPHTNARASLFEVWCHAQGYF